MVWGGISFDVSAQGFGIDKIGSSVNPFPLSEEKHKLLFIAKSMKIRIFPLGRNQTAMHT